MSTPITAVDVHSNLSDSCQSHGDSCEKNCEEMSTPITAVDVHSNLSDSCQSHGELSSLLMISQNKEREFLGWATLLVSLVCYQWFDLHGTKMTRREVTRFRFNKQSTHQLGAVKEFQPISSFQHVYFDEANLLRTSERLDFNLPPVIEDLTPGDIPESRKPLLQQLFRDEKDEEMQKWYKQHYGKVYENAMRAAKQERMMEEVARKEKSQKKDD
uniref:Uncharacterized protein n=1 Tax=Ascaris lumbricoides TaxID=6252 RepID=A0A9J2PDH6_ASCLU